MKRQDESPRLSGEFVGIRIPPSSPYRVPAPPPRPRPPTRHSDGMGVLACVLLVALGLALIVMQQQRARIRATPANACGSTPTVTAGPPAPHE